MFGKRHDQPPEDRNGSAIDKAFSKARNAHTIQTAAEQRATDYLLAKCLETTAAYEGVVDPLDAADAAQHMPDVLSRDAYAEYEAAMKQAQQAFEAE